ncbi:M56 family metallopeptidase [Catenuloplanes atrovinosus]|uniref:Zn-dependent protease with chaperone function n=1 Tax=Catenuloplanes atrovinosus TaxID=137266 RepID=A0AAE4CF58_9ACTN|nr:M56 family metallopeptidase [Catenuloplanes atrovinosus]MDR7280709.1 Zn-dependent protease with chaperone function [Catenuloplanes atrovinosus]
MIHALHFAGGALLAYLTARVLARARWTWRIPRVAIVCWQLIGLGFGLSAIGVPLALGLDPYDAAPGTALRMLAADLLGGRLPAGLGLGHLAAIAVSLGIGATLAGTTINSLIRAVRAQRRHRDLLTLVARDDPAAPGALVLDHPSAAAYCLPGLHPRVVVSAGTLDLLDRAQLAAVLEHERAHADERHDLVLLPFTALCRALPWAAWLHAAAAMVALLVEMRADDRALDKHAEGPLASALLRFATAGPRLTPSGALGAADRDVEARVQRLLARRRPARVRGAVALAAATTLVALPISLFLS